MSAGNGNGWGLLIACAAVPGLLRGCVELVQHGGDVFRLASRADAPAISAIDETATGMRPADDILTTLRFGDGPVAMPSDSLRISDDVLAELSGASPDTWDSVASTSTLINSVGHDADLVAKARDQVTRYVEPRMSVLRIQPRNETEFASIFGRAMTMQDSAVLDRADEMFDRSRVDFVGRSQQALTNAIDADDPPVLLIVGHNEAGQIRFADGSARTIEEISADCAANGKICVILSCEAETFIPAEAGGTSGVRYPITFAEAARITADLGAVMRQAQRLRNRGGRPARLTVAQLDTLMKIRLSAAEGTARRNEQIRKSGRLIVGGGSVGAIIYSIEQDRTER